jgi:hypothetical protein
MKKDLVGRTMVGKTMVATTKVGVSFGNRPYTQRSFYHYADISIHKISGYTSPMGLL